MKFLVIELQVNGDSTGNIVTTHDTRNDAESKFHLVLSAAAVSNVEKHSAVLLTDEGTVLDTKCYRHDVVTEEEE